MTDSKPSSWVSFLLLDTAPVVAVGVVVFHLLTSHVADCYPVPSGSMEPTIHGDRDHGDLVLVDKTAYWWGIRPDIYDIVVVRAADENANFMVKRCLAIGPAELRISGGDLYKQGVDGMFGSLPIAKDPISHADMRVPIFRHPNGPCEQTLEEFLHLPPQVRVAADGSIPLPGVKNADELVALLEPEVRRPNKGETAPRIPGFLTTNKSVDSSYLTPAGRRQWQGLNFYPDIGIELDLAISGQNTSVLFVLEYHQRDYALLWDGHGKVRLIVSGRVIRTADVPLPVRSGSVAFGYLDGHLFLVRGDQKLFHEPLPLDSNEDYRPGRPNGLHFGCAGGAVTIRRVTVFHDIAVTSVGGSHGIGQGSYILERNHMFLLGDNANDSSDSRGTLGGVPLDRLVGRPAVILAPSDRVRFFVR
jgi:signal peptidase I